MLHVILKVFRLTPHCDIVQIASNQGVKATLPPSVLFNTDTFFTQSKKSVCLKIEHRINSISQLHELFIPVSPNSYHIQQKRFCVDIRHCFINVRFEGSKVSIKIS